MLILHSQHPRSIRFSITEMQVGLRAISGSGPGYYANEAERLTGRVLEGLRYDTVSDVFRAACTTYLEGLLETAATSATTSHAPTSTTEPAHEPIPPLPCY